MENLFGYFLPLKEGDFTVDENSEDNSDDEIDIDIPEDMNEESAIGYHAEKSYLRRRKVKFREYKTGRDFTVHGPFQMTDPWWAVTANFKGRGSIKYLDGHPAYTLRRDPEVGPQHVVFLFLKACNVQEEDGTAFFERLREIGKANHLTFDNLWEHLESFGEQSDVNKQVMNKILSRIQTGPGEEVWEFDKNVEFFRYIPQLLPRQFRALLGHRNNDAKTDMLPKLQRSLCENPWMFGFSPVLSRELGLYGCEAQFSAFENSGLVTKLSANEEDALRIYDVLKYLCYKYGNTYVKRSSLALSRMFDGYCIRNYRKGLQFLETNYVIKVEDDKVYLRKLYNAEKNIAEGIHSLIRRHQTDPWTFDLDFESVDFSDIADDDDQKRAAELISQQPVVALSGRGGCGKTHVVSKIFCHAQKLINAENMGWLEDEDEVSDLLLTQGAEEVERSYYANLDETTYSCDLMGLIIPVSCTHSDLSTPNNEATSRKTLSCKRSLFNATSPVKYEGLSGDLSKYSENISQNTEKNSSTKDDSDFPVILLVAPTGKAANLLGKRAHLPSFTLHQVTFSYWNWVKEKNCEWKYSHVRALVADESSMVPVSLFSNLLRALLDHSKLKKMVLLGDISQLPSIEPGNLLSDVYRALEKRGCSVTLNTNHRSESDLIVQNAGRIASRWMPVFNSAHKFHLVDVGTQTYNEGQGAPNAIEDDGDNARDTAVRRLLSSEKNPCVGSDRQSQFIAFRRRDCEAINELCCMHYSGHSIRDMKRKRDFRVNDKVCCTRNATVQDQLSKNNVRLCNGEIFFITEDRLVQEDGSSKRRLVLDDKDGRILEVDYQILRRLCGLRHAWARTIHTFQGSEADTIVYVVGGAGGQTWQHVYTAVTRGRKQVIIVSSHPNLTSALRKETIKRNTSLCERLFQILKNDQTVVPEPSEPQWDQTCETTGTACLSGSAHCTLQYEDTFPAACQGTKTPTEEGKSDSEVLTNDSQTFSDWGDDVQNLVDAELDEINQGKTENVAGSVFHDNIVTVTSNKSFTKHLVDERTNTMQTSNKRCSETFESGHMNLTSTFTRSNSYALKSNPIPAQENIDHSQVPASLCSENTASSTGNCNIFPVKENRTSPTDNRDVIVKSVNGTPSKNTAFYQTRECIISSPETPQTPKRHLTSPETDCNKKVCQNAQYNHVSVTPVRRNLEAMFLKPNDADLRKPFT